MKKWSWNIADRRPSGVFSTLEGLCILVASYGLGLSAKRADSDKNELTVIIRYDILFPTVKELKKWMP
jgi:hypothetical protein